MHDYGETYARFRWPRHRSFNFARDVIDRWAARRPDLAALRWVDDTGTQVDLTFADVRDRSRRVASLLSDCGVQRGDTVLLILGRHIGWWEALTACIRGGFVASPGTLQLSAKDIAYRVRACGAVAVVTDAANASKVDEVLAACPTLKARVIVGENREGWVRYESAMAGSSDAFAAVDTSLDEVALLYFTSGTTGLPKMVEQTHGYALAHETTGRYWLGLDAGDLHWNISDTGWAKAAWSSYFGPWHQGACVLAHHTSGFDPRAALAILQRYPVNTLCAAPTVYRMLVLENLSGMAFPNLRDCVGAGEPLNPEVIVKWREATGITIRDGYGQTESVILCGSFPGLAVRPGSMGKPAPGIDLQVIDDEGRIVPAGQEGDIAVRVVPEHPLGLFRGFSRSIGRPGDCFRGEWYITGDRAYRDTDDYFWFVGRADDVILSAGYRIGPFEVESALIEHPSVAEAAVVSSPDEIRGEVVKAFVVLVPGAVAHESLAKELQDHVKAVTAPYKYPRKVQFVTELPKTVSGKIRRIDLRNREWGRQATGADAS
jgi:acyl-coenzyme A synthetase/AMP-(fatty) acid ligase